jgi:hypothetical protein
MVNDHQITKSPDHQMARRVLFVTGRLAEPALRRVLAAMEPEFAYDIAVMGITVAALMTTEWIARGLSVTAATDLVVIPGLCEGDPSVVAERIGVPVEKGPKDLREIPSTSAAPRRGTTTGRGTSRSSPRSTTSPGCPPTPFAQPPTTFAPRAPM